MFFLIFTLFTFSFVLFSCFLLFYPLHFIFFYIFPFFTSLLFRCYLLFTFFTFLLLNFLLFFIFPVSFFLFFPLFFFFSIFPFYFFTFSMFPFYFFTFLTFSLSFPYLISPFYFLHFFPLTSPTEVLGTSSKIHGCICMALIRTLPKVFESVLFQAIVKADVKEQAKDFYVSVGCYWDFVLFIFRIFFYSVLFGCLFLDFCYGVRGLVDV